MTTPAQSWDSAITALHLLAEHPHGLGGMVLRMRAGPDRDVFLAAVREVFPDLVKISPSVDDLHLFGGIDLAQTLKSDNLVSRQGLLDGPKALCLTMAERCSSDLAAKLCQYLDKEPKAVVLLMDEGADEDERCPTMIAERLAFQAEPIGHAPKRLPQVSVAENTPDPKSDESHIEALCISAHNLGIFSLRPVSMALQAARQLAKRRGRAFVRDGDLAQAAALVFGHRATQLPPDEAPDEAPDMPQDSATEVDNADQNTPLELPNELILDAVKAVLPPEVLAGLGKVGPSRSAQGNGFGQKRKGNRRGRPLPSRPGRLDGRARLDLLGTLRTAAPWQKIRRRASPEKTGLLLRPSDFRLKRYESRSDRLVIFGVDASGSLAVTRLGEVKGAIELLLGQAYSARDFVALVTFRGETADCLLPPTRSLVQTKRKLSALPGGGGTPLAAGMNETMELALQARARGMSPVIVLLTDGKTNIALDGTADRSKARDDATTVAGQMRRLGLEVLVLDTANRPQPNLRNLAQYLDATYMPLPRADAKSLSRTVRSVVDAA